MSKRLEKAKFYEEHNRHDLAIKTLRSILAENPSDWEAQMELARCLVNRGKEPEVIVREAQKAVALQPENAFVHYIMSYAWDRRGNSGNAKIEAREAIRLDPEQPDYFFRLAYTCWRLDQHDEMLEAAKAGLALNPEHVGCLNYLAMALSASGRIEEAHEVVERALALDPNNPLTHANRGWLLLEEGKNELAKEHFEEALRNNPLYDWAHSGLRRSRQLSDRQVNVILISLVVLLPVVGLLYAELLSWKSSLLLKPIIRWLGIRTM